MKRNAPNLETVAFDVPEHALGAYEAALSSICATTGFFRDEATGLWRVEGVKEVGAREPELIAALALAAALTRAEVVPSRTPTPPEGWLARSYAGFPEQRVGRRFVIRGTHLGHRAAPGRIVLTLDAGLAFGSGEHGSTRGCLRALERLARRRPHRVLDLGTGSGILGIAAARLLHRAVLATDIEPWAVRVAARNAAANGVVRLVTTRLADGWRGRALRSAGPFDLVLANILARPLASMAKDLAAHLAPGGAAVLSGLLVTQARFALAAHRRVGLVLDFAIQDGQWATLVVRRPARG